jgi:chromosome segregation protein
MEESGVTKMISVRLEHEEESRDPEPPQQEFWEDEEVEPEEGRELPLGVDDPSLVSDAELRPIRSGHTGAAPATVRETKTETAGLSGPEQQ